MNGLHLTGLEATNPLGFLAALGVQCAFADMHDAPRLWWSNDVVPHAIVDDEYSIEDISGRALVAIRALLNSPAVKPGLEPVGDVKFSVDDLRSYLDACRGNDTVGAFAGSLVAQGSYDNNGVAKPTDLHFTAGKMLFLTMVENVLGGVARQDIIVGLEGPWAYDSKLSSLMWDVVDDRNYALLATNPAKVKKSTNPGPEALAILGLSRIPVYGSLGRTLTQGASGSWKDGRFTWPVWSKPATVRTVGSLLAQASSDGSRLMQRQAYYRGWGISCVLQSRIRRSSTGGNGTIGPPEVLWKRD